MLASIPLLKVWRRPQQSKPEASLPPQQQRLLAHHTRALSAEAQKLRDDVKQLARQHKEEQNVAALHPDEINQLLLESAKSFQPQSPLTEKGPGRCYSTTFMAAAHSTASGPT